MKKAVRLILLLLMVFSLVFPACAENDEEYEDEYDDEEYSRMEGDTLILLDGVVTLGSYWGEKTDEGTKPDPEIEAIFNGNPGKNSSFVADFFDESSTSIHNIIWPSTIRFLGEFSFGDLSFNTLTLPASLERVYRGAFYRCAIPTVRIECEIPWEEIEFMFEDCSIGAYEAPEDHPLYKTADGVLYTKDGKTLLAYPNRREEEHFDIPAGVERIGTFAFENDYLKTVSLPIGLKELNDYAFDGCSRLQAIALPLTVTRIGTDAFYRCVSLERVSLPAGLEADKDDDWCIYYPDDSLFRGDNGDTAAGPETGSPEKTDPRQSVYTWYCLTWLKDAETVPVYETRDSTEPVSTISCDTPLWVEEIYADRSPVSYFEPRNKIGWVETKYLDFFVDNALFYMRVEPSDAVSIIYGSSQDDYDNLFDTVSGPWVYHDSAKKEIPLSEMILSRDPDPLYGSEELGITADSNPLEIFPLLDVPDGTVLTKLHVGTQIRILEEKGAWVRVSTGYDTGWIKKEAVRIVPVHSDVKEE